MDFEKIQAYWYVRGFHPKDLNLRPDQKAQIKGAKKLVKWLILCTGSIESNWQIVYFADTI